MRYLTPELELIRFENGDILTDSNELPIIPATDGGETNGLDGSGSF